MDGRLAVMQPYVFPYLPYFQLVASSRLFVFYDDVGFRPSTWMTRNRILNDNRPLTFTVPVFGASSNMLIKDVRTAINERWVNKFNKTMYQSYGKAPFYSDVVEMVMSCFKVDSGLFSDVAIRSVTSVFDYIGIPMDFRRSSEACPETNKLERSNRLIAITKKFGFKSYVNPIGGSSLYSKEYFQSCGIQLGFLKSRPITYPQFSEEFIPGLSIIDALMFNHPGEIKGFLLNYDIV